MLHPESAPVQAYLEAVACASFSSVITLEVRNSDRLDFHDCSVTEIRKALTKAFMAGQQSATRAGLPPAPQPTARAVTPGATGKPLE